MKRFNAPRLYIVVAYNFGVIFMSRKCIAIAPSGIFVAW